MKTIKLPDMRNVDKTQVARVTLQARDIIQRLKDITGKSQPALWLEAAILLRDKYLEYFDE